MDVRCFCFSGQFFELLSTHCRNLQSLKFQFFAERYTNRYFDFDTAGLLSLLSNNRKIHSLDLENAGFLCDTTLMQMAERIPNIEVLNVRYLP